MKATTEELEGGITKIVLEGRMDIEGSAAIDMRMNVIAGSSTRVLVDMAGVTFLGSMGLRSIVLPAQAVKRRGRQNGPSQSHPDGGGSAEERSYRHHHSYPSRP